MQEQHEHFADVGLSADVEEPAVFMFPPAPFCADEGNLDFSYLPYSEEWFLARGEEF